MGKTWLEVALNGAWTRARQPGIPISVDEIVEQGIASVNAGASIIHVHAYDESTGQQKDDAQLYQRIIEGIRTKVDAIVYPTVPATGLNLIESGSSAEQRYAHIEELAKAKLLEWSVVDPGSCNFSHYDDLQQDKLGFVYTNSEEDIRHGLKLARRYGFHPSYAIYEPGFARLGASLHWRESCPDPIYRLMFSRGYSFGFPPEDYGLTAYLNLLDQVAPGCNWMISGLDVDVLPLVPRAVMERGHVRVGLEDAPFGCERTNVELVEEAARLIENGGGTLATAAEVRIASSADALEESA
ncbi:MAG: 3-keto-5-aminohexanoate cleavage protein [Betaproteobacteria bacterium]|nr:MAG: 3-keto-5-aminohexanoate cleavage protein [Betaproteobacteria bacterium]